MRGAPEEKPGLDLDAVCELANASPFYRHIGMKVERITREGAETRMKVAPEHMNLMGIPHGGAVASLADSTCGLALAPYLSEGEAAVTQSLEVHYLSSAGPGDLFGKGRLVKRGRHTAVLEADLFDERGKNVAHAHTIHVITRLSGKEPGKI